MKIDHLSADQQLRITKLVQKHWCVFNPDGLKYPVIGYECEINTGINPPVAARKINYGPREAEIMNKHIAVLLDLGHIETSPGSGWLSKALLAPKPHQESIYDIKKFKWRFCVNYIGLNQVTEVIAYPIPRCDNAVGYQFGDGRVFWLVDCPQGYHQILVALASRDKLCFAGPDATVYRYRVMPFGPVNGPTIFIRFMHDMNFEWQQLARRQGISIDGDTNTKLIVDDLFNFAKDFDTALAYMECQFIVAAHRRLSFSLPKTHFMPERVEFVGVDVGVQGNFPAKSKHVLLQSWPKPTTIRDVASFVAFGLFYSKWIPYYEVKVGPLRTLCLEHYDIVITPVMWTEECASSWQFICTAILADPCLAWYDSRKRCYVRTDFCKDGFGFVCLQPADDAVSLAAMRREMAGGTCEFMRDNKKTSGQLRPIAFGSRRCKGYERRLHSHLGEGFAGDFGLQKCQHYLWGIRNSWITDSYAMRFILSYDGTNGPLCRLQMRLCMLHVDIYHRNAKWLGDADYFSRHGGDMWCDPLLAEHDAFAARLRKLHAAPVGPLLPENMPGWKKPRPGHAIPKSACVYYGIADEAGDAPTNDAAIHAAISYIADDGEDDTEDVCVTYSQSRATFANNDANDSLPLSIIPPVYEKFIPTATQPVMPALNLHNKAITDAATRASRFSFAVYGFNSGHVFSSNLSKALPFDVLIAADPDPCGRALFHDIGHVPIVLESSHDLLSHIASSKTNYIVDGYIIHCPRTLRYNSHTTFWRLQGNIIQACRHRRSLQVFVAHLHPSTPFSVMASFRARMRDDGWLLTTVDTFFPDFGDSIDCSTRIVIGLHKTTSPSARKVLLPPPPKSTCLKIADFLYTDFNRSEYVCAYGKSSPGFASENNSFRAVNPVHTPNLLSKCSYNIVRKDDPTGVVIGCGIYDTAGLAPPMSAPNRNIFGQLFGLEFECQLEVTQPPMSAIRAISTYEYASLYSLHPELTVQLAEIPNSHLLDGGIPARTSVAVMSRVYRQLFDLRKENFEVIDTSLSSAPVTVQSYFSGAIGARLPDKDAWMKAYELDPITKKLRAMCTNPSLINKKNLDKLPFLYRSPLRKGCIAISDNFIVLKEPQSNHSYQIMRIVPKSLHNIIFIASHANTSGCHFGYAQTLSKMRQRFTWAGMSTYIKRMCSSCAGCTMANATVTRKSDLLYNFPVDGPMLVLHVDIYTIGVSTSFAGDRSYLIASCGMTTFSVAEPVPECNSETFAQGLMQVMLRFGMAHTIVLDRDSKFFKTFEATCQLLELNIHTLSSDNHDPMIVERVTRYLNKGLKILCQERESTQIGREGILLLLYGWNSCPIPMTDISRSLVVCGREFTFPIDFSSAQAVRLTTDKKWIESYAASQADLMKCMRAVATLLVETVRSYHRERVNRLRPDPRIFAIDSIVMARRKVQSKKSIGRVDKVEYAFTGPWRVTKKLDGGSYEIKHEHTNVIGKRHAAHLTPVPPEMQAFLPVDGADTRYGQLYKPISGKAYKDAGIKGFVPPLPFQNLAMYYDTDRNPVVFPTVNEMNDSMFDWYEGEREEVMNFEEQYTEVEVLAAAIKPSPNTRSIPIPTELNSLLVASRDKLFFVAYHLPGSEIKEWQLVRVAFAATMEVHPNCIIDGKFLVDFYILHPDDRSYNAPNQRYWIEYHETNLAAHSNHASAYHLVKPGVESETYAASQRLLPYRQWMHILHDDVYIHGPFDFTVTHGRQSLDRISFDNWQVLHDLRSMFHNTPPKHELHLLCSVHCSQLFDTEYYSNQVTDRVEHTSVLSSLCFWDVAAPERVP